MVQKIFKNIFFYTLLFILGIQLKGQDRIKFENISVIDGLSNSTIQSIMQDSEGFMWFGTADGLNKYDGHKFTVYRDDSESPNSIKGNLIIDIYEDSEKNLWLSTELGLNRYNRDSDDFTVYQIDSADTRQFYNGIVSVYEDSKYNLWVAKAYNGLTIFDRDSLKFNQVKVDTVNQSSSLFAIWNFIEDSNGELWYTKGRNFNAPSELFKLNKARTREYRVEDLIELTDRQKNISPRLYKDPNNNLWFNTFSGFSIQYKPENRSFNFFDLGDKIQIYSGKMDVRGEMWYASVGDGLINYNLETKSIITYKLDITNPQSPSSMNNIVIYIDRTGIFWLGTADKGIDKFDPFKEPFELYSISKGEDAEKKYNTITSLGSSYSDSNRVWVGTDKGLYIFNVEAKSISPVKNILKSALPDDFIVRTVMEDKNNFLWIGTNNEGIYHIDLKSNKSILLKSDPNDKTSLSNNRTRDIIEDSKGNIWIATLQGINKYNYETNAFLRYKFHDTTYTPEIENLFNTLRNSNKILSSIIRVPDNSDSTMVFNVKEEKDVLIVSVGEVVNIQVGSFWDYGWLEDSNGNIIWMMDSLNTRHAGGALKNKIYAGLMKLKPGEYKLRYKSDDSHSYTAWNDSPPIDPEYWGIEVYEINESEKNFLGQNLGKIDHGNSISGSFTRSLYEDSKGDIWIGTNNSGFSIYSPETNSFKQYNASMNSVTGFSSSRVNSFLEGSDGSMWIATFGGLINFQTETENFNLYTSKDGIPTNYVLNLLEDNNGNVWFSSQKGLTQFNTTKNNESMSFINFDIKDGLQAYQFNTNASLKLSDGRIMFGGIKGFNVFFPGNINNIPPEVVVTKLFLSNEVITTASENSPLSKSISQMSELNLSHNQNDISFEFTALHYARPDKNQYAHMLEGFDEDWIYDNRSFATYTNLDPKEYVFKVKASNSDGVWNNTGASINILITSPWWATIWAYLSYVLIAGLLFFSFNKAQKNKIIRREHEKQKIQEAELRAKAAEAESRAIHAESERKTKELEEARNLQLSMLPKVLPDLPHLDIAVYMKTATEVGGDYYDFHVSMDGTLTAVIGDATGHGLNAGTIVTVTKSLFNSHASNSDILFTFDEISRCLKEMKFKYLSMCLMILKIKGNQMQLSAAGMPPALIYRKDTGKVEEFLIKGMPLGAPASLPYELKQTLLNTGDTILLMSDGFPELLSEKREMLGYDTARSKFEDVAEKQPEEIITYLKDEGSKYVNGAEPDDDVTFVVIKIK